MEENILLQRFDEFKQQHVDSQGKPIHLLRSLERGDDALLARIYLIRNARHTIDIQTFIWANDQCGRYVFYELLQAAQRGVQVRVLIDGWALVGEPDFFAWMHQAHQRVHVKRYSPPGERIHPSKFEILLDLLFAPERTNQRSHNKLFVVDNLIAILGGRNYQNSYYDRGETHTFRDRDVVVVGEIVTEITQSFERFWECERAKEGEEFKDVDTLYEKMPYSPQDRESFALGDLFDELEATLSSEDAIAERIASECFCVSSVEYVCDPPKSDPEEANTTLCYLVEQFSQAQKSLLLQTPYFILDSLLYSTLQKVREENPSIEMLVSTNSMAASDTPIAYAYSYRERLRYLIELRLQIFELQPIPSHAAARVATRGEQEFARMRALDYYTDDDFTLCCHAKTFVVDEQAVWIGSPNLDPRSGRVNTENGIFVRDEEFAKSITATIHQDLAPENSWIVGLKQQASMQEVRKFLAEFDPTEKKALPEAFEFVEAFELQDGAEPVSFFDDEFYSRYRAIGAFPKVKGSFDEIRGRLITLLPEAVKRFV